MTGMTYVKAMRPVPSKGSEAHLPHLQRSGRLGQGFCAGHLSWLAETRGAFPSMALVNATRTILPWVPFSSFSGAHFWVANMVGQHGMRHGNSGPPIRYDAVADCLKKVAVKAADLKASIHVPRIGCGLAGGEWSRIEPLIQQHLCEPGLQLTVSFRVASRQHG